MAASVRQHTLRKKQNCGSDALKHCSAQTHVVRLPDEPLPGSTLEALVTTVASRSVALVDMVIRVTLDDVNVRKHGLLTFHQRGFSDFLQETPNGNIENAEPTRPRIPRSLAALSGPAWATTAGTTSSFGAR